MCGWGLIFVVIWWSFWRGRGRMLRLVGYAGMCISFLGLG